MSFPNIIHGSEELVFNEQSSEDAPVGAKMIIEDGRVFRYSECGATATVIGNVNSGEAPSTNYTTEVIDTLAAGVTVLTGVGATAAAATVNTFNEGYIYTDNATTLPMVRIKSNAEIASGGTGDVTIYTATPTAIAAANTVSYIKNPWRDVIIHGTPPAGVIAGVSKRAITAASFGWLQTQGPCSVLYDSDTTAIAAVGDPVCASATGDSDGSVSGLATATAETNPIIAYQLGIVEGNAEQNLVFLVIE